MTSPLEMYSKLVLANQMSFALPNPEIGWKMADG